MIPKPGMSALGASETVPEAAGHRSGARVVNPLDTLDRILASLHGAMLDETHWPATAALIDEASGAVGNALVVGEWSGDDVRVCFARFLWRGEPRPDVTREYFDVHYPHDEGRRRLRELPAGQLFHARDLYTEKELRTSSAYNEGLRRGRGQNGLQARLDWQDGHRVVWTVGDPIATGGWQSAQLQLLESLLPHVRQFVRVRQALVGADALSAGLAGLLRISEEVEHRFRPKWNIDFGGSGTPIPRSGTRISGCGTRISGEVERWFRSRERSSVA